MTVTTRRQWRRRAIGATAAVMVAAGLQGVASRPAAASTSSANPAPVSNAFAMGGGLGGTIDERTGAFQASIPLLDISGRAGVSLSLSLSYDQSLAAQGSAGDHFGFGTGWSLGIPWLNTVGAVQVYPASGGSYRYDAGSPTGLYQYPLMDLHFAKDPGTVSARQGLAAGVPYTYTLTYLDGTVDRFDANGNLVERVDRFGNRIDITWQHTGSWWQPASVTDNYGQVTTFDYSEPGTVKIVSPPNFEGVQATVILTTEQGRLATITDPADQMTRLYYTQVAGLTFPLLGTVVSPTGAKTTITYDRPIPDEPGLVVVDNVRVLDASGKDVLAERRFFIDPPGDPGQHNYTGYPIKAYYQAVGQDGLFDSGDMKYLYTTELSDGTSMVKSTYNSLHLLMDQRVSILQGTKYNLQQDQCYLYLQASTCDTYPAVSPAHPPANYAEPTAVKVTYGDALFGSTRAVATSSAYNNLGELVSSTDAGGTVTTTEYGSFGLPVKQTVTGADGATSITVNTLTGDGKAIKTSSTAVGSPGQAPTARTVTSYGYDGFGELDDQSATWATGAAPPGPSGGPDAYDQTSTVTVNLKDHTSTDVVTTAAGTPQAASATTVSDLVTGETLSQTDPSGLTTSYRYDAAGRILTETAPGNQTTTTAYDSPTTTTTTSPDGLITRTTTDVLGRTVKVTDNVTGEKLVANPGARTVYSASYSPDGMTVSTSGLSRAAATTTLDPLGRPIATVQPDGITQTTSYNDVANTQTTSVIPAGASPADPTSVTVEGFDNLNQPVSSSTTYADGTPAVPVSQSYDGLGRVTSVSSGNVIATPSYAGAGGLQTGATLTPTDTSSFPGAPVTAATGNTMTGSPTLKILTQAGQSAPGDTYSYDAAGRVATATTPGRATTRYTYTPDGKIATVTSPSGILTTYRYDNAGRLQETDVTAPGGTTQKTAYDYYPATGLVKDIYDPADPGDQISYDYDADGHTTAIHYPDGTTTAATYADTGELATSTDVTGAVTSYTYNADGKCGPSITDLCGAVQKRDGTALATVSYTYDSLDRVATIAGGSVTTKITYTDASQVSTETTTTAGGSLLLSTSYTYDSHGNVTGRTDRAPGAGPSGVTATAYTYDAYNRLTGSATYPGTTATGTPATKTSYTLNVSGDVTGQTTTTGGATTTTVNTIAPGDQLTSQSVNGKPAAQDYDADGNVTKDLADNTYTYNLTGQPTSVTTPAGTTTSYTYWPDRTLRNATTAADGVTRTTTFHYNASGQIVNDTYTDGSGPAVTGSYLIGLSRESRTLITGTGADSSSPAALSGPATVKTDGPGAGYYVVDGQGSVAAMVDADGQVTSTYRYTDYGVPTETGAKAFAAGAPAEASVNPFTYDGAYTNPQTGTQYLPARTYDPSQGRFLSLDGADLINRYQAFNTNPINFTDPTGQLAVPDIVTDIFAALLFVTFAVVSYGAAAPAVGAVIDAIAEGTEVAATTVASAVLNSVSTATNIGAAATSATLVADDAAGLSGNNFLSAEQRQDVSTANFALGTIAGFTGAIPALPGFASETTASVAENVVSDAATQTEIAPDPNAWKRAAIQPDDPPLDLPRINLSPGNAPGSLTGQALSSAEEPLPGSGYSTDEELFGPDLAAYYNYAQLPSAASSETVQAATPSSLGKLPTQVAAESNAAPPEPWADVNAVSTPASQTQASSPASQVPDPVNAGSATANPLAQTAAEDLEQTLGSGWTMISSFPADSLLIDDDDSAMVNL